MRHGWLNFAGLATKQGIDSLGPTDSHVTVFFLSLCRDYGFIPQALKDGVSAEPHQQVGDGAGQNYPLHAKFSLGGAPSC